MSNGNGTEGGLWAGIIAAAMAIIGLLRKLLEIGAVKRLEASFLTLQESTQKALDSCMHHHELARRENQDLRERICAAENRIEELLSDDRNRKQRTENRAGRSGGSDHAPVGSYTKRNRAPQKRR